MATDAPSAGGAAGGASAARTVVTHVRILAVNDVYSEVARRGWGGWAGLAALARRYRGACPGHTLLCVNGDFLGGSATTTKYKGKNAVEVMNALGCWGVCIGNHEFDGGDDNLRQRMAESRFAWITGNVMDRKTGGHFGDSVPTKVVRVRGGNDAPGAPHVEPGDVAGATDLAPPAGDDTDVTIGFFGLCTPATPQLSYPSPDVEFVSPTDAGRAAVAKLSSALFDVDGEEVPEEGATGSTAPPGARRGVDVIIGLTHLRLAHDLALAKELGGVTALLGGHDHEPIVRQEADTLVIKFGQNAYWLGVVDLRIEVTTDEAGRRVAVYPSFSSIVNAGIPTDPGCPVAAVVEKYAALMDAHQEGDDEVLLTLLNPGEASDGGAGGAGGPDGAGAARRPGDAGESDTIALDTRTNTVRRRESGMANVMADAFAWFYGRGEGLPSGAAPRDVLGMINGGFIRGDTVYPFGHQLTVRDMRRELPFPREVVLRRLRGRHIRAALEQHLTLAPAPSGGFPHLSSGAHATYDPTAPVGSRIQSLTIFGRDVGKDSDDEFFVAISGFMADGGDGASAYLKGLPADVGCDSPPPIKELVIEYLRRKPDGEVYFHPRGRLVALADASETN